MRSTALLLQPLVICLLLAASCALFPLAAPSLRAQGPGTVDPVFGGASLGLLTNVTVIVPQPDGKVLLGGDFSGGIVRLNPDGNPDASFKAATDFQVYALAVQPDGKILVGGFFTQVNGVSRNGFVRLNPDGSLDTSFNPSFEAGTNLPVYALVLQPDGKVLVGGVFDFTQSNGARAHGLARLNADGSPDPGFSASLDTQFFTAVEVLALQPDGKILVGGSFYQADAISADNLTRLNADGSRDASFNVSFSSEGGRDISTLAVQPDGRILVGGNITQVNGVGSDGPVRLNADGSLDASFSATVFGGARVLVLQPDGKVLVSGSVANSHDSLVRLNADGSRDASFTGSPNYGLVTLTLQSDGKVLIAGEFTQVNGVGTNGIVRLTATGQIDNSFNAATSSGPNAEVSTLALQPDGKLLGGGAFSQINGNSHTGLARLKTDGSPDVTFSASFVGGLNYPVSTVFIQADGKFLVGGGLNRSMASIKDTSHGSTPTAAWTPVSTWASSATVSRK